MTDAPGRLAAALADRYTIERELGAGGMATVYLAHDIKHQRDVAIKVLHPDLGAALGSERFLSEIRTTARLQHPHILPLLDSGSADGLLYYVMPLVTGETLRARLDREHQLPIDETLRIAREVADALGYAHGLGVIHRDIKPENILLQGGHALVADFGIALAVQSAGGQRMTQTGLSLGTPQYMSPEQAMGERAIDARSDIYALGAVTYEMLAGDPPFTGSSVQAIVAKIMTERPTALHALRDTVPELVEDAVFRALSKLPADRFASAAEFARSLDLTTSIRTRPNGPSVRTARGGRHATLIAVALVLLMTGVAAWGWLRPGPSRLVVRYRIGLDSLMDVRDVWGQLAMSPDGSMIAFGGGPNGRIHLRRRQDLDLTAVPSTDGGRAPFFSPDGTRLGYLADNRLIVVSLDGGIPITYADSLVSFQTPVWENDGFIYGISRGTNRAARGISRMAATPGAPIAPVTQVDTAAGEQEHYFSTLLPGGKAILFGVSYQGRPYAIAVGDTRGGKHAVLMQGTRARYIPDGHIVYSTIDNKLWTVAFDAGSLKLTGTPSLVADRLRTTLLGPVDFAVSTSGTLAYAADDASLQRELIWVARTGKVGPVDSAWNAPFVSPVLSMDGTRLAVSLREFPHADIWIKSVRGGAPVKLTLPRGLNESPAWTADGRSVTYIPGTGVSTEVWRKSVDGGEAPVRLFRSTEPLSENIWSRAGDWLVVRTTTGSSGAADILGIHGTDTAAVPIVATSNTEYNPTLSPDGRWMAYVSNEAGRSEVYVVPFPNTGSRKWQVSTAGGALPLWSRRGGEIFYLDGETNMVAAEVSTNPTFSLGRITKLFSTHGFAFEGYSRRNFDVSPDDQRFLMVRRNGGAGGSSVVVVENWFEERRAKAAQP